MSIEIEMAQIQLRSGIDLLYAVYESVTEHPDKQADYSSALYGAYHFLKCTERELAEAIAALGRRCKNYETKETDKCK